MKKEKRGKTPVERDESPFQKFEQLAKKVVSASKYTKKDQPKS